MGWHPIDPGCAGFTMGWTLSRSIWFGCRRRSHPEACGTGSPIMSPWEVGVSVPTDRRSQSPSLFRDLGPLCPCPMDRASVSDRGCNPIGPWLLALSKMDYRGLASIPQACGPRWRTVPIRLPPERPWHVAPRKETTGSPWDRGPTLGRRWPLAGSLASPQGAGPQGRRWPRISEAL